MKEVRAVMMTLIIASTLCAAFNMASIAIAEIPEEREFINRRFLGMTGTYFELNNSEYLNVTITSTATVRILLSAPPEMIDYFIESADGSDSTTLTLGSLQPSTTYYMYEDSYMNEIVFTTDSDGSYTYTQDLSQSHHVFIQPRSSTTFICESTTLTHDIYGSVVICADNIVLDLNGYSIIGPGGYGITCGKTGVTIRNGAIDGFTFGIWIDGSNNIFESNTVSHNFDGIHIWSYENTIRGNNITCNSCMGIVLSGWGSDLVTGNDIYGNTMYKNVDVGVFAVLSDGSNKIYHNDFIDNAVGWPAQAEVWWSDPDVWDDGYPSGGNYWSDYEGVDFYGGPDQNVLGSDGIGDTAYEIYMPLGGASRDRYPLMSPWTPAASVEEVDVAGYPVLLASNSKIANIVVTRNTLHFTVSGPEGSWAYVYAVLPIGLVTTEIKVFLNHAKLTPPPYPVITTNSTHYFVYLAVTFTSIYDVAILFAPITATVNIDPDTLNLKSNGQWITAYITLPEEYNVEDINPEKVELEGILAAWSEIQDGVYMAKFDRATVRDTLTGTIDHEEGVKFYDLTLTVTGEVAEIAFEGSDTVTVITK